MSDSQFRTVEVSEPHFEAEGLRWVTVKSRGLRRRADLTVFVPPEARKMNDVPIVLLLHGVYGSHWAWALKGGAHRTTARLIGAREIPPMILAMPSDGLWGDGSGYLPGEPENFERWIVEDVPAVVREVVPCTSGKSPMFLNGLSMGGFGALRLAGKHPKTFRAAGGHSSITHFHQFPLFVEEPLGAYHCPSNDQSVLETLLRNRRELPALRFDCGTEDQLLSYNRELSGQLNKAGIHHVYEEFPGGHSWPYWETHLADMLRFFGRHVNAG